MTTFTTGRGRYTLYSFTGKVLSSSKNMETQVSGSGGGGGSYRGTGATSNVRITSRTIVHTEIFLEDSNGKEKAIQLQDFNLACRDGNLLTMLWAIKEGADVGPYIIAYNHTTDQCYYSENNLRRIFMHSKRFTVQWGAIIGAVIGLLFGFSGLLWGAVVGAGLGYITQIPDKKAIQKFKSQLTIEEQGSLQLATQNY